MKHLALDGPIKGKIVDADPDFNYYKYSPPTSDMCIQDFLNTKPSDLMEVFDYRVNKLCIFSGRERSRILLPVMSLNEYDAQKHNTPNGFDFRGFCEEMNLYYDDHGFVAPNGRRMALKQFL
jgi:hypothetical protein